MTLSEEGYNRNQMQWITAIHTAKLAAPEGFKFIGFLWGHEFTHGPFLATEDKPGPIGQAIYAKIS